MSMAGAPLHRRARTGPGRGTQHGLVPALSGSLSKGDNVWHVMVTVQWESLARVGFRRWHKPAPVRAATGLVAGAAALIAAVAARTTLGNIT